MPCPVGHQLGLTSLPREHLQVPPGDKPAGLSMGLTCEGQACLLSLRALLHPAKTKNLSDQTTYGGIAQSA